MEDRERAATSVTMEWMRRRFRGKFIQCLRYHRESRATATDVKEIKVLEGILKKTRHTPRDERDT